MYQVLLYGYGLLPLMFSQSNAPIHTWSIPQYQVQLTAVSSIGGGGGAGIAVVAPLLSQGASVRPNININNSKNNSSYINATIARAATPARRLPGPGPLSIPCRWSAPASHRLASGRGRRQRTTSAALPNPLTAHRARLSLWVASTPRRTATMPMPKATLRTAVDWYRSSWPSS